jgi:hypothetical protein
MHSKLKVTMLGVVIFYRQNTLGKGYHDVEEFYKD